MPRPKYSCNRCGEQFEFDQDAISHLMAGKCEIVRCPECGHAKGCTCETIIDLLKACVKERDEELTKLRAGGGA